MAIKFKIPHYFCVFGCLVIMGVVSLSSVTAEELDLSEFESSDLLGFQVKSGLIYNFLKYTQWPEHEAIQEELHVCLLGGDSLGGTLESLSGRTAQKRLISVSEIEDINPDQQSCHLVFFNKNQEENLAYTLEMLEGLHILTVSDIDYFSNQGGMVEFVTRQDHHINLHINNTQIERAGLSVEDRILRLAEIVR